MCVSGVRCQDEKVEMTRQGNDRGSGMAFARGGTSGKTIETRKCTGMTFRG